jgi:predicted Ser/Thr protein kinase
VERVGNYIIERKLGQGGMGTVYLARSRGGRPVAVKVARTELAEDPVFRERFRAEVAAARRVGGFHTAPVVDADPDAPAPWFATAYVPGPTLAALVAERGPMDEERLRGLGAALAEALQAVHACGLVHRDLKPGNIIMAEDGPRVLDFGIARAVENTRLTATGAAFGTPGFLAPEQAEGREVTSAADVFALGAVLVAAAGGSAFGDGTSMALMYRSVHHPADLSAVPGALRGAVGACLEKDPARRPTPERLLDWFTGEAEPPAAGASSGPGYAPTALDVPATPPAGAPATPGTPPAGTPAASATPGDGTPATPAAGFAAAPTASAPAAAPAPPVAPPPSVPPAPYVAPATPPPMPATPPPGAWGTPAWGAPAPVPQAPPPGYGPPSGYPGYPVHPGYPGAVPPADPDDGEDFLAMDRRNGVVADADGVSFGVNGRTYLYTWDEIRGVTHTSRGRTSGFTVTVVLLDGTARSCRVGSRGGPAELALWSARLDAVVARHLPVR